MAQNNHELIKGYRLPKYFEILNDMNDKEAIETAGEEIAMGIEHQSTLWHATPLPVYSYTESLKALEAEIKTL